MKCNSILGLVLLSALSTSGSIQAASLADLFSGSSLIAGDKQFTDWTLVVRDDRDPANQDLGGIDVTPLTSDPLNPGLKFTGNGNLTITGFYQLMFDYTVSTVSAEPLIHGNTLELTDWQIDGTGSIQVNESFTHPIDGAFEKSVFDFGLVQTSDSLNFSPIDSLRIRTNILLSGRSNGVADLRMFEQHFSQIPEPSSLFLLLSCVFVTFTRPRRQR